MNETDREYAAFELKKLHMALDAFTGEQRQRDRMESVLKEVEDKYIHFASECFLCYKLTVFQSVEKYPCCWTCLQGPYHQWHRDRNYGPLIERNGRLYRPTNAE